MCPGPDMGYVTSGTSLRYFWAGIIFSRVEAKKFPYLNILKDSWDVFAYSCPAPPPPSQRSVVTPRQWRFSFIPALPPSPISKVSCDPASVTLLLNHGWFFMVPGRFSWFFWFQVGYLGFQVGFHGFSWFQVGFHGISWFQVCFSWFQVGFSWFFMVFFSKMYPPKLYPGLTIHSRSAAQRAA